MAKHQATKGGRGIAVSAAIVLACAILGMAVDWGAPGVERYMRDWLMRARGPLAAPDDIAIVAIDEPSIARFGQFPWPRSLTAQAIERIAKAQPKVIALDILYVDRTTYHEDDALARSIELAGNVVVAAQLTDSHATGGASAWLEPLPAIAEAAAAVGHVNVQTESEGIARELLIRAADDAGSIRFAMPIETVRVAQRIPPAHVKDTSDALLLGPRSIPLRMAAPAVNIAHAGIQAPQIVRPGRMAIDYIGPPGSFSATTYSFADVIDGRVPASSFQNRYVLIGATAASMGDRVASPFVHYADVQSNQHGSLMPGVEVLANAINTILRSRYYSELPDWLAFFWALSIPAATLAVLRFAQGRQEGLKQLAALLAVGAGVVVCALVAFKFLLVFIPVTPGLVSFASAGVLGLMRRSLVTSARLDASIHRLAEAAGELSPPVSPSSLAESLVKLLDVVSVAVFVPAAPNKHRLAAIFGLPAAAHIRAHDSVSLSFEPASATRFFDLAPDSTGRIQLIVNELPERRWLVVAHAAGRPPSTEAMRLAAIIADSHLRLAQEAALESSPWWPEGLESKAVTLGHLNTRLLGHARFIDLALRSVDDGIIIAAPDGTITFANPKAAAILDAHEHALVGRNLLDRIAECAQQPSVSLQHREILARLLIDRLPVEREISIRGIRPRRYILRLAAMPPTRDGSGPVIGITASLSDITRQQELQQMKNDVISLVSHEMRTPLTAIQGMTELLASYDVDAERRKELNRAINDETKRLTRMVTQYLDITRLEAGATAPRFVPVRVETVLERVVLLLEPVAGQCDIRLVRRFHPDLVPVMADSDLLARAVENLVSNAVKYSPPDTTVEVAARAAGSDLIIDVQDQGYGIPVTDLSKVFDKFYRVPRMQDASVPGTGLGLSLVKEIAHLHGGSITVRSVVNVGSTFTLRLPLPERSV